MSCARLIVGLGNPGPQYVKTRHNAGFWFLERLAQAQGVSLREEARFRGRVGSFEYRKSKIQLLMPMDFMNHSGFAVSAMCRYWKVKPEELLVVHDDLDFEPGVVKLKYGGGHGGHNGLRHIIEQLGSNSFFRLRLGIGHPGHRDQVVSYVLGEQTKEEGRLTEASLSNILGTDVLPYVLACDIEHYTQQIRMT